MGDKPSVFTAQTICFLLLELYIFMYHAINQQNVDFRSFLSVLPYIGTEISHSRYA